MEPGWGFFNISARAVRRNGMAAGAGIMRVCRNHHPERFANRPHVEVGSSAGDEPQRYTFLCRLSAVHVRRVVAGPGLFDAMYCRSRR